MRLELDDPRLMDYVLGELEDGEALTVAAALEQEENKEARELVEELRGVTEMTRRILHEEEPGVALSDEQRAAIVGTVGVPENVVPFRKKLLNLVAGVAALALFAAATAFFVPTYGGDSGNWLANRLAPALDSAPLTEGEYTSASSSGLHKRYIEPEHMLPQHAEADVDGDGLQGSPPASTSTRGLSNVEIDGSMRIRGNWYDFDNDASTPTEDPAIVEARNRLEMKANPRDGLSLTDETGSERPDQSAPNPGLGKNKPQESPKPEPKPAEEQWAEYNVGNLTGQTELPTIVASDHEPEGVRSLGEPPNNNLWQWNSPTDKPTEIVGGPGTETYVKVAGVKPFVAVRDEPLSTFSIDVDTAAYSNVRRFLSQGQLPPADAVRIEEMINYFAYSYPQPTDGRPFAVAVHGAPAPWAPERQLVRIGVKGKEVPASERPPANLVFLLDVSGSMGDANKLPLVKESMKTLLSQLRPNDRVGIVTYAGDARLVLGSTPCSEGAAIVSAIESLQSGGSTNGGGGIQMAYDLAQSNFIKEGINRVVMATDGDFNVGTTEHGDLMGMIEARAKSGVFLTTLGFGMGNLKDSTLEQLANRGNGNYAYIDNHAEARKALVDQLSGTLQTIAKDVKIQVEFNPAKVSHYRLLGYENRALANQDFNDDTKDAGEIGAGHTVTALYEIIPAGVRPMTGVDALKYQSTTPGDVPVDVQPGVPSVDALKYQSGVPAPGVDVVEPAKPGFGGEERFAPGPIPTPLPEPMPVPAGEWLTVKMRYKQPEGNESTKIDVPLLAMNGDLREADADFRFASAVAAFGQVLRNSGYRHSTNFDRIIELARGAANGDADREAFVDLVITAKTLSTQTR
jgi:Ca-activated chloride channel family protein